MTSAKDISSEKQTYNPQHKELPTTSNALKNLTKIKSSGTHFSVNTECLMTN